MQRPVARICMLILGLKGLKGLCYVCYLLSFYKAKTFFPSIEFQKIGPVLSFKTIFRYWNCFLLPVAMNCKDGRRLKLDKVKPTLLKKQ